MLKLATGGQPFFLARRRTHPPAPHGRRTEL